MPPRLQVLVYENRQLKESAEFDGPVELGRQRDRDEGLFSRKRETNAWRWVIARRDETTIGRNQMILSPMENGRIRVTNGSDKQSIRFLDRPDLQPGACCEATLPVVFILGATRTVRVQLPGAVQSPNLSDIVVTPRTGGGGSSRLPSLVLPVEEQVSARKMVTWLHSVMDVLLAATDSSDSTTFFDRAAGAVFDTIALDTVSVLLLNHGRWEVKTTQMASEGDMVSTRGPSMSILERVRQQKRTIREDPCADDGQAPSLMGIETVVATPILSRAGEVVGALYGERRRLVRGTHDRPGAAMTAPSPHTGSGFTELEAMLVELAARGVATGLARLEEERKVLQHRAQFEQFFTPELARQLMSRPDMLVAKDREVTVLFSDIRGFSRISERLGPEATMDWMGDVMTELSACIRQHEGVLVDYVGDEVMAMWGAPNNQPDHAQRACRAALDMLDKLPVLNGRWQERLGEEMTFGIGINTGVARVGNMGSRQKFKYGPLGNTVNLASRVQGATKHFRCKVLLTGQTQAQLDPTFLTRRLGQVRLVGLNQPVELYELFANDWPFAAEAKCEYEKGLELFEQRQFAQAARTLINWRGQCPTDDTVLLLIQRAVKGMVEGAPPDDEVWQLTEK
jgi:adenylate cyclase